MDDQRQKLNTAIFALELLRVTLRNRKAVEGAMKEAVARDLDRIIDLLATINLEEPS